MRNPFRRKSPQGNRDYTGMIRSTRERPRRFAWLRKKWVIACLVVLLLVGGGVGYGAYVYFKLQGDIQEDLVNVNPVDESEDENAPDPPFNVLLVGSDSREGLTEEEQERLGADDETADGVVIGGERADTLIIAHVDPETDHVTMVQFPRDIYVPTPDGGKSKINETLVAGDEYLVETVTDLTGIEINHFAKVNIAGFRYLVDAIGGVEVCIPDPIPFDPQTGIEIKEEETGMVEFDGDRALRFVRSRHYATGDFQRIQNQQKFLAAAIDKMTSPETFLHLSRVQEIANVARDHVTIDSHTTIVGLYNILKRFRAFHPDDYEAYTAPNFGTGSVELSTGETSSIVVPDMKGLRVMFDAIDANESPGAADGVPDVDASTISVGVYNGTKVDGAAQEAADDLVAATTTANGSVTIEIVADADKQSYDETVVTYKDTRSARRKAKLVAAAIPGAELEIDRTNPGVDVAVTVGKDFKTKPIAQIVPIPIPEPEELPEECRG